MVTYVLDACAMLAALANEQGADVVDEIYEKAVSGEAKLTMHKVNLLEVYYDLFRTYGKERADEIYTEIRKLPIHIFQEITDEVFFTAGRLKVTYKISLADAFALAQAIVTGGEFLTTDHHEFDLIVGKEPINFHWVR